MKAIGIKAISFVGTTLLSMILGSHPKCRSVGHCYVFFEPWKEKAKLNPDNVCAICSLLEKDCSLNRLTEFDMDPEHAYEIIASLIELDPDEHTIIDSSSTTSWFDISQPDQIIYMFRNPLTLASSYIKSLSGERSRGWIINYMCRYYNKLYAGKDGLAISYDNLLNDNVYIRGLFSKLGLEFFADYLEYWNFSNHMVGGNRGVLLEYARHHKPEKVDELIKGICKGNKEYEKYYKNPDWTHKGGVNLLTPEEEDYIMGRCGATYGQLKGLEECLL